MKIKVHYGALLAAILFFYLFSSVEAANIHYFVIDKLKEFLCKSLHVPIKITSPFLQHAPIEMREELKGEY